jgi:carbon-monoxide dehydrogenase large subunit
MDYALPRAADAPAFSMAFHLEAPTAHNPLGVKGAGEAGCVGALPAVVNAVMDALREFDVYHVDMPLTAERVWQTIRAAKYRSST